MRPRRPATVQRRRWSPAWGIVLAILIPVLGAAALFVGGITMTIVGFAQGRSALAWWGVALLAASVVAVVALRAQSRRAVRRR